MALPYHPKQGEVIWCDYRGLIEPEMVKKRLAVVISPKFINRRDLCTVVPLSTTVPMTAQAYHHKLDKPPLPHDPPDLAVWAKCDMLMTVSFERLSGWWGQKVDGKRVYTSLFVSRNDLICIRKCMLYALGLGGLTQFIE